MEGKKYQIIDETIEHNGHTLYRIQALESFNRIKRGDLGGWIEKEKNLSQFGNCWVFNHAKIS